MGESKSEIPAKLILYDGVCNLCNRSVQFVLKKDKGQHFYFASLQSELGQILLEKHGLKGRNLDSFVYIHAGKVYVESSAALRVSLHLRAPWPLMGVFLFIPPFVRNSVYRWIAKNRYRWFGKTETCWLPSPEWSSRFLDV